jgi:hypothetical protein
MSETTPSAEEDRDDNPVMAAPEHVYFGEDAPTAFLRAYIAASSEEPVRVASGWCGENTEEMLGCQIGDTLWALTVQQAAGLGIALMHLGMTNHPISQGQGFFGLVDVLLAGVSAIAEAMEDEDEEEEEGDDGDEEEDGDEGEGEGEGADGTGGAVQ